MKKFIAMLSLFTIICAQAATISEKSVSIIQSKITSQREEFIEKTAFPIGNKNFVAVTSFQIQALLSEAEKMLEAVISEKNLSDSQIVEKIKEIDSFLMASEKLIYQLPY